jgi:hypothetical protein
VQGRDLHFAFAVAVVFAVILKIGNQLERPAHPKINPPKVKISFTQFGRIKA